ncbi:bifunctional 4-hydroxy-2-oxoglutarate aldolase/2-dehydro-3-deoxy-phosphogluconate aldolase [Ornithinimicrobium pratense]|uniref:2-dehydro-3-deoxy-phosphogluconate aldolase n=1 Tax=Ornithinimicrobium pratense TaxID=2593973 RepID=A0A5J6V8Q6_9MICO|nr:bifunctional 4-hydroxy-2-oxoglutarate aldolase/2-dehydro-3-deoxy-phosphogluconate aldolase [Ornithinimicrobium pratense]QFG69734.1 bifunctional 4-hydroxy-2-oxoglutarate aldolase/2-dehydro-3-deoxy-phosphogluconate aldolase [Ornithinimicrobium pratense]
MSTATTLTMEEICRMSPVVPVVKVPSAEAAVSVAKALVRGGVPVIELTLRTPAAIEAIRAIAAEVPDIVLGAGTVTTPEQVTLAVEAGARFVVSPGSPADLQDAVLDANVPALLGAATTTEMMQLANRGWRTMKFFPAEAAGGATYLANVRGPLPDLQFCPTGGVNRKNAADYLALANVACVGGSWITPEAAIDAGDWATIERLAGEAAQLGG